MKHRVFISVDALRDVPPPTSEQRARFVEHVCGAHSWYKAYRVSSARVHFAVFLWRGGDFWRGSDFAPPPRECGNYHELHGYLAYGWRGGPDEPFAVDVGGDVELEPALLAAAGVVTEPYISTNCWATIAFLTEHDPRRIETHPRRKALGQLIADYQERTRLWNALPRKHRDAIVKYDRPGKRDSLPANPQVAQYLQVERQLVDAYLELQAEEIAKLEAAIDRVLALRQATT